MVTWHLPDSQVRKQDRPDPQQLAEKNMRAADNHIGRCLRYTVIMTDCLRETAGVVVACSEAWMANATLVPQLPLLGAQQDKTFQKLMQKLVHDVGRRYMVFSAKHHTSRCCNMVKTADLMLH